MLPRIAFKVCRTIEAELMLYDILFTVLSYTCSWKKKFPPLISIPCTLGQFQDC